MEKAELIDKVWIAGDIKQNVEHQRLRKMAVEQGHALPAFPMKVFPQATSLCVLRGDCYHRHYRTHDTSTSKLVLSFLFLVLQSAHVLSMYVFDNLIFSFQYLQLNQLLDIVNHILCYSFSHCIYQALHPILLVCMELSLFGMSWSLCGITSLTIPSERML